MRGKLQPVVLSHETRVAKSSQVVVVLHGLPCNLGDMLHVVKALTLNTSETIVLSRVLVQA